MLLEGKKAIVTGGTRGIGRAAVESFLKEGATVSLFGSRQETADKAVAEIKAALPDARVFGFTADLTNLEDVLTKFEAAKTAMGGFDILVNNAGVSDATPLADYTEDHFDEIIDLNVKGVFNGCKAASDLFDGDGSIVNTSSIVGLYGSTSAVAYPTSKFAVNGLTKTLARELGRRGIRVNAVAPGVTDTDMVAALPEAMRQRLYMMMPLGRFGTAQEVANAIVFLASDLSSYVTGEILSVDGGAVM